MKIDYKVRRMWFAKLLVAGLGLAVIVVFLGKPPLPQYYGWTEGTVQSASYKCYTDMGGGSRVHIHPAIRVNIDLGLDHLLFIERHFDHCEVREAVFALPYVQAVWGAFPDVKIAFDKRDCDPSRRPLNSEALKTCKIEGLIDSYGRPIIDLEDRLSDMWFGTWLFSVMGLMLILLVVGDCLGTYECKGNDIIWYGWKNRR